MTIPLTPQALLWGSAGFALVAVLCLAMMRSKWREELGDTGDLDPPRRVGKHPALGASYRQGPVMALGKPAQIVLTCRDLEHVNILRRHEGMIPLNLAGFCAAAADQARMGLDPIYTKDGWLAHLVNVSNYEKPEHQSFRVAVDMGITIQPDAPLNGQHASSPHLNHVSKKALTDGD